MTGADREDRAPAELEAWIGRFGGDEAGIGGAGGRTDAAVRALRAALARTGRDREGAFALLAADGLITSAARDHAQGADPDAGLRALLAAVTSVPVEGEG